ncbi:MAG: phosphoribosylformylglycinamidine synthase subunit PurL [Chloroflexi bacterium]|nr:phosphoribosylformylglycinamidine synthase subunit PurL [Chloroflexota bacterium]
MASLYCLVVSSRLTSDPRAAALLADAHTLSLTSLLGLECKDLYFIQGTPSPTDLERLASQLLVDPVAQRGEWRAVGDPPEITDGQFIEVALRPGVTDPVAAQIMHYAQVLGISNVKRAATGQRFVVHGSHLLSPSELHTLACRLLFNPVIQRYALGPIDPVFPQDQQARDAVDYIPLTQLGGEGLMSVSRERRTALDLSEMLAIRAHYREAGREPSDVELETIAQTWSEHCVHKTFRAQIDLASPSDPASHQIVDNLLKTYVRAATETIHAPWVRSAFVDNAGIVDFDDEFEISFKVETHNHPSAIEPFGGANTGIGGVIRDIIGVSAKPIAATDILCFGPQDLDPTQLPEGVLHPRRIRSGVVAGIQDYGNKIGIPTVNGAVLYDPGYTANPLVFCGCVGLAPKGSHPRSPHPGDRVIVLGGRTGRDGLRGATFSSMTMDAQTGEVSGASVQIGDPITEKGLIEVMVRARDARLYHAITDCGAGGLSSAVGEMARDCGAQVDLSQVRLKYTGLAPWEVWLSEAQERMVLAVPDSSLVQLQALCDLFEVELTDIGVFNDSKRLVVRYGSKVVLDLPNAFLHDGMPQRHLPAIIPQTPASHAIDEPTHISDFNATLLQLLGHPNISSKADIIRVYDHEVQGGTVVKPLTGVSNDGPSDACVIKPLGTRGARAVVLANGVNSEFGKLDPYRMAVSVVDEAIRNAVAVGADPSRIALLDNFCWGDPLRPDSLGGLVEAARGCHDAALHYGTPFISGKDSLNNEYIGTDGERHSIPPTLLISSIGIIDDIAHAVTMDLKEPGDVLYLLGETRPELGGSHLHLVEHRSSEIADLNSSVPSLPPHTPALYRTLHQAIQAGSVRACHDLSEGGLAVAAAEMCIGGKLGMALSLESADPVTALFSESNGRLLVEVRAADGAGFEAYFKSLRDQVARIGTVTKDDHLSIGIGQARLIDLPVDNLVNTWNHSYRNPKS